MPTRASRIAALAILLSACAGSAPVVSPTPAPSGSTGITPSPLPPGNPNAGPAPLVQTTWPIRTREHVDLWLHTYALITRDTTLVPYFRRGYRDRISALRTQQGASSLLYANRERLLARITVEPSLLTAGQFLPLYFSSWEQMHQIIDQFVKAGGNPSSSNDPNVQTSFAILASAFQSPADREWLRLFTESVDDESRKFYHAYWTAESRARAPALAHVDSLWQRQWRPQLQRFLNNTQQQNGEIYLSLPLGGEGRTVQSSKTSNAVAGPMPESVAESESVLYVVVHEVTGPIASSAIADNTTPADQRAGLTSRYEQSAAVRAGALLLERTIPTAVAGYMRYYLQASGATVTNDARTAFNTRFAIPEAVRAAIARQLDVVLGGI